MLASVLNALLQRVSTAERNAEKRTNIDEGIAVEDAGPPLDVVAGVTSQGLLNNGPISSDLDVAIESKGVSSASTIIWPQRASLDGVATEIITTFLAFTSPTPRQLTSWMFTCRRWNAVIDSAASLWTILDFSDAGTMPHSMPPTALEKILRRSSTLQIEVRGLRITTAPGGHIEEFVDALARHMTRISTIDLTFGDHVAAAAFESLLLTPAPMLREASLSIGYNRRAGVARGKFLLPAQLFAGALASPQLRTLRLKGVDLGHYADVHHDALSHNILHAPPATSVWFSINRLYFAECVTRGVHLSNVMPGITTLSITDRCCFHVTPPAAAVLSVTLGQFHLPDLVRLSYVHLQHISIPCVSPDVLAVVLTGVVGPSDSDGRLLVARIAPNDFKFTMNYPDGRTRVVEHVSCSLFVQALALQTDSATSVLSLARHIYLAEGAIEVFPAGGLDLLRAHDGGQLTLVDVDVTLNDINSLRESAILARILACARRVVLRHPSTNHILALTWANWMYVLTQHDTIAPQFPETLILHGIMLHMPRCVWRNGDLHERMFAARVKRRDEQCGLVKGIEFCD